MIYTITLNPAIDQIIETSGFNIGETNYYDNDYSLVGGKGINVSVILNNLNTEILATGLLGKQNKEIFISKFNELNLKNNFIMFDGKTRTNFKIKNLSISQETELNGLGSTIDKKLVNELLEYLKLNIKSNDIVIAAGSIPKSIESNIYLKIGEIINKNKGIFILDTSKQAMIEGIKAKPFLIKPNLEEICEILNKEFKQYSFEEIKSMVDDLKQMGAQNILVSMGSKGSIFFSKDNEIYKVGIAKGKLVNSVGSGDSMIGGFAYGIYKNLSIEKTLQYGAAAGGATAFTKWLGTKKDIEKLVNTISVEKL